MLKAPTDFRHFRSQALPIFEVLIGLLYQRNLVRNLCQSDTWIAKEKLFTDEFTIMATMRTNKHPDGYLFAIVNSLDTVIQLGVRVSSSPNQNHLNVSLVYNDAYTKSPSDSLALFQLPFEPKVWINFAIQVMNDRISLYHNCIKIQELNVSKEPRELVFESASTFYLAQAGNTGSSREKFEVSLGKFCLYWNLSTKAECHRVALASVPMSRQFHRNVEHVFLYTYLPGKSKQFPGLEATHAPCRTPSKVTKTYQVVFITLHRKLITAYKKLQLSSRLAQFYFNVEHS